MRLATRLMPSASATEEPPYFCTTRAIWTRRSSQVSVGGPPPSLSAPRHQAQSLNGPGGKAQGSGKPPSKTSYLPGGRPPKPPEQKTLTSRGDDPPKTPPSRK